MFLGRLFLPARGFDQSMDELLFAGNEIDHAALCMSDQCDAANSADSDGIRNFEFAVPQIRSPRTDNESEIIGDVKVAFDCPCTSRSTSWHWHTHPTSVRGCGTRAGGRSGFGRIGEEYLLLDATVISLFILFSFVNSYKLYRANP